jgi:hypothetical protein
LARRSAAGSGSQGQPALLHPLRQPGRSTKPAVQIGPGRPS